MTASQESSSEQSFNYWMRDVEAKKKLTIFPQNLCAGEMQVAQETVTRHIGMPIITEEDTDEGGTTAGIPADQRLFFNIPLLCF